jgi:hypothetical protein
MSAKEATNVILKKKKDILYKEMLFLQKKHIRL